MKVVIYNWAGDTETGKVLKELGYEHNQEMNVLQPMLIAKRIFDKGINVMLRHQDEGILIACDSRGFGQR